MPTSKFLVTSITADQAQIRIISGVGLALFLGFVAALFYAPLPLPRSDIFMPVSSAILVMADTITATLLFAEAKVLRSRALGVLGAGYLFTGLMLVMRAVTFAGAFTPYGFPGTNADTAIWMSAAAQAGLPIAIMVYLPLNRNTDPQPPAQPSSRLALTPYVIGPVAACILVTWLMMASKALLPPLTVSLVRFAPTFPFLLLSLLLLIAAAMARLWYGRRTMLDLWLLLVLFGLVLEMILVIVSSGRFTVGWYMGQVMGLLSSLFVLFTLIAETNRLYGQSVQELEDQDHERERRFLIREAIGASIAHEVRQPLAAILLNAHAARKYPEGQSGDMAATLNDIISSGHRAHDIIQSTRAILGGQAREKRPVDLEALVRGTLEMVSRKARSRNISAAIVVEGTLKPVSVDAVQIQQTLLNLFQNAICALTYVEGRDRILEVRCIAGPGEEEVTIRVEDNGRGIDPEDRKKVFTPFFTTRKHGTGLGLMIASLVLEAHGGQIGVEPLSPFGTAFVIRLPYGRADMFDPKINRPAQLA
jgi:signal transduction histidine kinase